MLNINKSAPGKVVLHMCEYYPLWWQLTGDQRWGFHELEPGWRRRHDWHCCRQGPPPPPQGFSRWLSFWAQGINHQWTVLYREGTVINWMLRESTINLQLLMITNSNTRLCRVSGLSWLWSWWIGWYQETRLTWLMISHHIIGFTTTLSSAVGVCLMQELNKELFIRTKLAWLRWAYQELSKELSQ